MPTSARPSPPDAEPPAEPELSVLIPVMDEAETISEVLEEVGEKLGEGLAGEMAFEVVVVDDGSRDRTPELVLETAADRPWLRLVRHRANFGKSAALVTGARAARGRWIATMDGDGQNDPADVVRLALEARRHAREGRSVIVAGRRRRRRDTWLKRLSSRVANRVRARLLHDGTPDTACGLKVFERRPFLEIPRFENMHRFLPALFLRQGIPAVSIEVDDRPRAGGVSKYGFHNRLWVGIADMLGVLWLQRRRCLPELLDEGERRP